MDALGLPSQEEFPSASRPIRNISLFKPEDASLWNFIFTPAFGAWIHARNWSALGEEKRAQESMHWFFGTLSLGKH